MENKEYYTPKISELFAGYECEVSYNKGWIPYKLDAHLISRYATNLENEWTLGQQIRTPYLSKEDIVELGWQETGSHYFDISPPNTDDFLHRLRFTGDKSRDKSPSIEIIFIGAFERSTIFYGKCKSKNELKKLMKDYLNISL